MFSEMAPDGAVASASRCPALVSPALPLAAAAPVRARSTGAAASADDAEDDEKRPERVTSHQPNDATRSTTTSRDSLMGLESYARRPRGGRSAGRGLLRGRRRRGFLVRFDDGAQGNLGLFEN